MEMSTRRRVWVSRGQKTLPQTPSPMPEPSPLLPCLCLFYFSCVVAPPTTIQTCMTTRPTTHTLSRHKYPTYNPVRCAVRFPYLTRSILSQNIRTATPLLKKLPPCVPLSRPLHLCTKKPNLFAFPFHKYSTYSPVRCAVRLPYPTRSMLSKKIRVVPPLSKKRRLYVSLPSFCPIWRYFTYKISSWSHYMTPRGGWPILILRGVSQPTPNAPEVPRAIGVCLDISNTHIPKYVHICNCPHPQNIRQKRNISPNLGLFDGKPHLVPYVRGM